MDGELLANEESDKLVDAIINKDLSWEEHIAKIGPTVNRKFARAIYQHRLEKLSSMPLYCHTWTLVVLYGAVYHM